MKHNLDVRTFSIIPVQSGIQVNTPDGVGTYEGINSSGIVSVLINGGVKSYSWSDVIPDIRLNDILLIEELKENLVNYFFKHKVLNRESYKKKTIS